MTVSRINSEVTEKILAQSITRNKGIIFTRKENVTAFERNFYYKDRNLRIDVWKCFYHFVILLLKTLSLIKFFICANFKNLDIQ